MPAPDVDAAPDRAGPHPAPTASSAPRGLSALAFGGWASLAAGAVHASAAGIHAEHPQLARIFIATAALQMGVGLWALLRSTRRAAWCVVIVNAVAVSGWLVTRLSGISWIDGLETSEARQFADTACAILGLVAVVAAGAGALHHTARRRTRNLIAPSMVIGVVAVATMVAASTHLHAHDEDHAAGAAGAVAADLHADDLHADDLHADDHDADHHDADSAEPAAAGAAAGVDDHHAADPDTADHHDDRSPDDRSPDDVSPVGLAWPRPWDPTASIDVSGVEGVTAAQEQRAAELIAGTLRELPRYADPAAAVAAGYASIGDAGTGTEHYIKGSLVEDGILLDPTAPESLVYAVDGERRTLMGAMYIAGARPADDPSLTDWAGPLMTWHKHDNLCWGTGADGKPRVVGVTDGAGNCANGVRSGGENPMVHVWIAPHPCGVFAALEGIGAGTAAVAEDERVDMCSTDNGHGSTADTASATPQPYDPTMPIDLSGTPGVTPQQQAAAENLIAVTVVRLPQWSDYRVAEASGFRSIGDAGTGHEHFIQWDWIDDEIVLDPDYPESLVYEPQPDGTKKLVSAMYMLPTDVALADVPDIGGDLMQWHIHDNLCYTDDPVQPQVVGVTSADGTCPDGLVKHDPAPMIHVWITPHPCGPFASLEGVGAGQIATGETRLCDHRHGS